MDDVSGDLQVSRTVVIPSSELTWRFSRSSGPGGQSVNTTDSRVELAWDPRSSTALTESQRNRVAARLVGRLTDSGVVVVAADHRSQWQNRRSARLRLADVVAAALAPPPRRRKATRPTRGSVERRMAAKRRRSQTKRGRSAPAADE